jgi:hypothetical protein
MERKNPPLKKLGMGKGPRRISGGIMEDLPNAARFLGVSEKALRARVMRRLVPYRRWGGRIIFLRKELESFFNGLSGCPMDEAIRNDHVRGGDE